MAAAGADAGIEAFSGDDGVGPGSGLSGLGDRDIHRDPVGGEARHVARPFRQSVCVVRPGDAYVLAERDAHAAGGSEMAPVAHLGAGEHRQLHEVVPPLLL